MPERRVTCAVCSVEFTPKRKWAAFCSAKCRYAAWARLHPRTTNAEPVRAKAGSAEVVAPEACQGPNTAESYNAQIMVNQLDALRDRIAVLERRPPVAVLPGKPRSTPADWKHGANCYRNHGCRCEVCVSGMRARSRTRSH